MLSGCATHAARSLTCQVKPGKKQTGVHACFIGQDWSVLELTLYNNDDTGHLEILPLHDSVSFPGLRTLC